MNKNLPLYFDLLNDDFEKEIYEDSEVDELRNFSKLIIEFTDHLESLYYDFFNSSHITIDLISDYIIGVTNTILSKFF